MKQLLNSILEHLDIAHNLCLYICSREQSTLEKTVDSADTTMNNSSSTLNSSIDAAKTDVLTQGNPAVTLLMVFKLFMSVLVALVSLVGNIMVIFVVFKTKRLQTNTYFLIVNMSVSDLLYTAIAMPPFITGMLGFSFAISGHWGMFLCKFINGTVFGLIASSVLTLAAISCDRFFTIVYSLKKLNTRRSLKFMIISIWVCSVLVISPMLYAMRLYEEDGFVYCHEDWSPYFDTDTASKAYTIALFIVIYMIPFTTTIIFYSSISHYLWFRKVPEVGNKSNKKRIMASRRKVILMLITTVLCFIICWLPLQIVTFSYFFGDGDLPVEFFFASEFLIRANGAINPVIYAVFNETFRRGFKSLLSCVCSPFKSDKHLQAKALQFSQSTKRSNDYLDEKRGSLCKETNV